MRKNRDLTPIPPPLLSGALRNHILHRATQLFITAIHASTSRGHDVEAVLDGLKQGIVAFLKARRPGRCITQLGCIGNPCRMAAHTGLLVDAFTVSSRCHDTLGLNRGFRICSWRACFMPGLLGRGGFRRLILRGIRRLLVRTAGSQRDKHCKQGRQRKGT